MLDLIFASIQVIHYHNAILPFLNNFKKLENHTLECIFCYFLFQTKQATSLSFHMSISMRQWSVRRVKNQDNRIYYSVLGKLC